MMCGRDLDAGSAMKKVITMCLPQATVSCKDFYSRPSFFPCRIPGYDTRFSQAPGQ